MLSPSAYPWPGFGVTIQDCGHPNPGMTWGAREPRVLGLEIRVPREEDRAWKLVTALKASSPKKHARTGTWTYLRIRELDMAAGCTPQLRAHSMDVRGPWEFRGWSKEL